jgi:phage tail sheath protein FI
MAFQLSAGVNVSEIDLTTVVPSVATSTGAFAGPFAWGPANTIITISDETRLVDKFGNPDDSNYEYWFSASNFLAYSNNLKVVRAINVAQSRNATSNTNNVVLITNEDSYESSFSSGSANAYGVFASRYAGSLGNSLKVSMADANSYSSWTYASEFDSAPGTSTYTSNQGGLRDELHIIVIDEDGKFTGTQDTILEKYQFVSKAYDAKTDSGDTNYYKNVLAQKSEHIYWMDHPYANGASNWGSSASGTTFANLTSNVTVSMTGGVDGTISTANVVVAYDFYDNAESVDISLVVSGPANQTLADSLISMASTRKDCLVFLSPEKADCVNNPGNEVTDTVAYRNTLTSSSYAVLDNNWKYQYDKYNDEYRWIPCNGDIAGLCARTDLERDPWYSPGGMNRGVLKNVIKLAYNPTKTNRDELYTKGINPIVSFPGEGTVLFGDKTMLSKPSAFDRINVRRLFTVLEKSISRAARFSLFEFNDQFTRAQFIALIEPFLRDVQGRRGIIDFRVVCDETNNTPEVIDRNEFVGDIYIKPSRSINFIQLNFVAVRTGVSFDEVVGQF